MFPISGTKIDNKNKVVITEPYSNKFIQDLSSKQKYQDIFNGGNSDTSNYADIIMGTRYIFDRLIRLKCFTSTNDSDKCSDKKLDIVCDIQNNLYLIFHLRH